MRTENMATRCRKFVPNLFNKTKCQSCFGAKEAHTAEALESSKVILTQILLVITALCRTGVDY